MSTHLARRVEVEQILPQGTIHVRGPYRELEEIIPKLKELGFRGGNWMAEDWEVDEWTLADWKVADLTDRDWKTLQRLLRRYGHVEKPLPVFWMKDWGRDELGLNNVPLDRQLQLDLEEVGFVQSDRNPTSWTVFLQDTSEEDWDVARRALARFDIDLGRMPAKRPRRFRLPEPQGKIKTLSTMPLQVFVPREGTFDPTQPLTIARVRARNGAGKPIGPGLFWTSSLTAKEKRQTSGWLDWCQSDAQKWITPKAGIYEVKPGAAVASVDTRDDYLAVQSRYPQTGADGEGLIDWAALAQDYDGFHVTSDGAWSVMGEGRSGAKWDVEQTVWFNAANVLKLVKAVAVEKTENEWGWEQCVLRVASRYLRDLR